MATTNTVIIFWLQKRRTKDLALIIYNLKEHELNKHRKMGSICVKISGK
jgi:hypothetical protein